MSYHDGSVWPHDNSLILLGLSRLGFVSAAAALAGALIRAAEKFEYHRLPELFCGYDDSLGYPVSYPVACSPQAWAAGTSVVLIQAMLGLEADAPAGRLTLRPWLPEGVNRLTAADIPVGRGHLSVELTRTREDSQVEVRILANTSGCRIETAEPARAKED
jgi:glycogen debranching enzyme